MPGLPVALGDQSARTVAAIGYVHERTHGSHMILHCEGRTPLSVPRNRELGTGLLRKLIRDAGLTVEEFVQLLER